jgi:benzoylformate decarboxylase
MKSADETKTTVRDAVFELMRAFSGDTLFGNPGSTELPMYRDFPQEFRYVLGLQEAVVVGMADGYAQATGKIAFVNLHSAAGVGNAMGNIYTAHKNRSPLVIIAGQQSRSILPFDPYLASEQAAELPKPHIKWSVEPARAEDVPLAVATACYRALQHPPGPVLVSIPADDWDRPAELVQRREVSFASRPDPVTLSRVATDLEQSERPAFVIGADVDRDGAWEEVKLLAERHRAAVFVAPMSGRCSFPEDHPQFMGFLPAVRSQIVQKLQGFDFVLAIGAPVFTYHVEGDGPHLTPGTVLCQITEDAVVASRCPIGTSLVASVRLAARDLLDVCGVRERPLPEPRPRPARAEPSAPLSAAFVLQTLAELRSRDDIVVEEAPTARIVMHQHLPMLHPGSFFTMASGGLGYGMPAATGIALAHQDRRVIGVIGDGSSMYSIQTLWTAAQMNVDVTYVILNNGVYGALKRFGGVLGFPANAMLPGTDLPGLDFVALARGHGCNAKRVSTPEELEPALREALSTKGPSLIEVLIS